MGVHDKCKNDEERLTRKRAAARRWYHKNKDKPEFKIKAREQHRKDSLTYYYRNRERLIKEHTEYNAGVYHAKYNQNHRNYYQKKSALDKKKEVERVKLYREKQRLVKLQVKLNTKNIILIKKPKPVLPVVETDLINS